MLFMLSNERSKICYQTNVVRCDWYHFSINKSNTFQVSFCILRGTCHPTTKIKWKSHKILLKADIFQIFFSYYKEWSIWYPHSPIKWNTFDRSRLNWFSWPRTLYFGFKGNFRASRCPKTKSLSHWTFTTGIFHSLALSYLVPLGL